MTLPSPDGRLSPQLPVALRVDGLCMAFEKRWREDERPKIEECLVDVPTSDRLLLLKELLALEVDLRREVGETPCVDEYAARFASDRLTIETVFKAASPSRFANSPPPTQLHRLERIGDYRLRREAGRGAMGIVYEAEHETLGQRVAIKVLPPHALLDAGHVERFRREARAAASLHHTNIVQVFGVGEHDGIHFYVMQFIDGLGLDDVIEQFRAAQLTSSSPNSAEASRLRSSSRRAHWQNIARIGMQVANALDHAHVQGVLHRDIKPSNLLVDTEGTAWIADFGLAKAEGQSALTRTTDFVGTLLYMAPERLNGVCDPRSDLYSLGLTLYELLTLRPAYSTTNREMLLEQVLTADPPLPRSINPSIPRDLETICLRCIQKEPSRRYASAHELAADLQRWLNDEPIRARRVGPVERLACWSRRNPLLAASLAGVIVVFVTAFAMVSRSYVRAEAALAREQIQRQDADIAREEAQRKEKTERWERYRSNMSAAASSMQLFNIASARDALEAAPPEHRNWEWNHFARQLDGAQHVICGPNAIHRAVIAPNGKSVALLNSGLPIRLWDVIARKEVGPLRILDTHNTMYYMEFSPDGKTMVCPLEAGGIAVHEIAADEGRIVHGDQKHCRIARFSPDGTRLATAADDRTVRLWDVASGEEQLVLQGHDSIVGAVAFSPDGQTIASVGISPDRTVRLWDVKSGRSLAVLDGHEADVPELQFNSQGNLVVSREDYPGNALRLWDAHTGAPIAVLRGHNNKIECFAISGNGTRIASGGWDQTVRLWDGETGQAIATLRGHRGCVNSVAFSEDSSMLASASRDKTVRLWDADTGTPLNTLLGHRAEILTARYVADSSKIVSCSTDGEMRLWNAPRVAGGGSLRGHRDMVYDVAFHPDGSRAASASWDGSIKIWDVDKGQVISDLSIPEEIIVAAVAFHPDGQLLAALSRDDTVRLWDVETATVLHSFHVPSNYFQDSRLAFSPRGDLLAAGGSDFGVHVWDVNRRVKIALLQGHNDCVHDVVFSRDGTWLASVGEGADKTVRIWDVSAKKQIHVLEGHTDGVYALAVSRDGKLLASGAKDGTVRLWDSANWQEIAVLNHGTNVYGLDFTPDGTRLACACANNTIRLWDMTNYQAVCELHGHDDFVHQVAFSPDGTRLISASGDSTLRVWDSSSHQNRAAIGDIASPPAKSPTLRRDAGPQTERALETTPPVMASHGATDMGRLKAGDEWRENGAGMTFCWCPNGWFKMGKPGIHGTRVYITLTRGFWTGKTEVTQAQWLAVMKSPPPGAELSSAEPTRDVDRHPAIHTTWEDATKFCEMLTHQERATGRLSEAWEYRLPTDAQWEFACRGGTDTAFSFGDDPAPAGDYAWFASSVSAAEEEYAHEVATKKPNPWGLHDMHGNVWEWCRDFYRPELPGVDDPVVEIAAEAHVVRGGSWPDGIEFIGSDARRPLPLGACQHNVGFRVVLVQTADGALTTSTKSDAKATQDTKSGEEQ